MNTVRSLSLQETYLNIRPSITQSHRTRLFIDIGKSVIDMRKVLEWDLLRWELPSVNPPTCQPEFRLRWKVNIPIDLQLA